MLFDIVPLDEVIIVETNVNPGIPGNSGRAPGLGGAPRVMVESESTWERAFPSRSDQNLNRNNWKKLPNPTVTRGATAPLPRMQEGGRWLIWDNVGQHDADEIMHVR